MDTIKFKLTLGMVMVVGLNLFGCNRSGPEMPSPTVEVAHPSQKQIIDWDDFAGRFRAKEQVDLRARIAGYLDKIQFTDGQMVKKGDVLFVIDQRPLKNAFDRATANLDLNNKVYQRALNLKAKKFIADETVDQNKDAMILAQTALTDAKINLDYSEIKSPIDGQVGRHLVDVGNLVNAGDSQNGTLLTSVVSLNPIQFYFIASEQDLLKYNNQHTQKDGKSGILGHKVTVKLSPNDHVRYAGSIDFVDNKIDNNTGTIEMRASFPNPDNKLVPGLFGRIRVASTEPYKALLVPDICIGTNQTQKFVYVVGKDNTAQVRPVVLGPVQDDGLRVIRSGITTSDNVIVNGFAKIRPGMPVTVKKK